MKKLFFVATALLCGPAFFNPANAQMLALKKNIGPKIEDTYAVNDWPFESVRDARHIELSNPNIIKHFTKNFADIPHVKWYIVENGMIAKFNKDNLPHAISYSSEGNWRHTVKYYAQQYIPADIKEKINRRFKDFSILRARAFQIPDQPFPVYLVQIQKGNQAKTVRTSKAGTTAIETITLLNSDNMQ